MFARGKETKQERENRLLREKIDALEASLHARLDRHKAATIKAVESLRTEADRDYAELKNRIKKKKDDSGVGGDDNRLFLARAQARRDRAAYHQSLYELQQLAGPDEVGIIVDEPIPPPFHDAAETSTDRASIALPRIKEDEDEDENEARELAIMEREEREEREEQERRATGSKKRPHGDDDEDKHKKKK